MAGIEAMINERREETLHLEFKTLSSASVSNLAKDDRKVLAKAKGYEGEMCGECGHFSLVRNGTCMKCDTCGSTTGCS